MHSLEWQIQNIGYRAKLVWKSVMHFVGFCPKCYSRVNYDRNGRALCPECKR